MPEQFLEEMEKILKKEDYEKLLQSYLEKPKKSIRLQQEKIKPVAFENMSPFELEKIDPLEASYYVKEERLGNHPYHHAGLFYIQEPSAMLPPLLAPIKPNFKILDLCAAPGGKTLSLSNQVPDGFVLANEINYNRAKKLLSNVERLGLKNVCISSMSSNALKETYHEYFDVILIDAPCSGEGMFRKDETARKEWSKEKIEEMCIIGKHLLEDSASMLKKGGYLIYSTCTFNLLENECQIIEFLKNHIFEIVDISSQFDKITCPGIQVDSSCLTNKAKRCYPYLYGEGQFMIVLQKKEESAYRNITNHLQELNQLERKIVEEFLKNNMKRQNYIIKKYQNNIVILPNILEIPKMTLLSCFVKMGEIEKERFIPHHQFVKAYGEDFMNCCNLKLGDKRILSYLKGEEIAFDVQNGYGVILVDGYPLGLFKSKDGRLKNHYPKGLRYHN